MISLTVFKLSLEKQDNLILQRTDILSLLIIKLQTFHPIYRYLLNFVFTYVFSGVIVFFYCSNCIRLKENIYFVVKCRSFCTYVTCGYLFRAVNNQKKFFSKIVAIGAIEQDDISCVKDF